jgi:hypothetical protein
MWQNTSVIDKMYKKLIIQVSLNGFSFAIIDTLTNKATTLQSIEINSFNKDLKIEDVLNQSFENHSELNDKYDEIIIVHNNNLSTFVPTALFDEEYLGSYLQFNTKVFETDFFAFDELKTYQMHHVYIPYVNLNNYFIDRFGSFDYKHAHTVLVEKLLDNAIHSGEKKMYTHVQDTHFEIIVIQNKKLLLFNSFEYKTPEDFIYYILFTAEQLELNPEEFKLELLGEITEESALFLIAYKYIKNIKLMDVSFVSHPLLDTEKRRHFTLLLS